MAEARRNREDNYGGDGPANAIPLPTQGLVDYLNQTYGTHFKDGKEYADYIYGGGVVRDGYYYPISGDVAGGNPSLGYNPAPTFADNFGLYAVGGIAGLGALANAGVLGGAGAGSGELASGMDLAGDAGSLFSGNGALSSGGLGGATQTLSPEVLDWASQYPGGVGPDGTMNWDAINQGMADTQGVVPGTGTDFPYNPTTGVPDVSGGLPGTGGTGGGMDVLKNLLGGGGAAGGINWGDVLKGVVGGGVGMLTADKLADQLNAANAANAAAFKEAQDRAIGRLDTAQIEALKRSGAGRDSALGAYNTNLGNAQNTLRTAQSGALNANQATQDKYFGLGDPYRDMLQESYAPGFSLFDQPGYAGAFDRAADLATRQWSPRGNPANNPSIQGEILNQVMQGSFFPQLNNYRGQLNTFGQTGLGTAGSAALQRPDIYGSFGRAGADLSAQGGRDLANIYSTSARSDADLIAGMGKAGAGILGTTYNSVPASNSDLYKSLGYGLNTAMGGLFPQQTSQDRVNKTLADYFASMTRTQP